MVYIKEKKFSIKEENIKEVLYKRGKYALPYGGVHFLCVQILKDNFQARTYTWT